MRNLIGRLRRPISRSQLTKTLALISDGDGSTLSLDFTAMSGLDSRFTFSRASTATFINSSGLVESAANGVARFDHDPATLAPKGLLIEGSVTNLIAYSNASTTGWTGLNATGSNDNATSPDGTTSATLWTGQSGGQNRVYSGTFNVTSGSAYTVSAWFKKPASNGSRYVKIYVLASNESSIGWPSDGVLDLNTGTASGTGFTVTAYSNNWYRVVSTGTSTSTTTARAFIAMCTSTGGLLTTTESMLVWGAQLEAGSGASSYIPTGSGTVQRAADLCSISGSAFASFYGAPTGWTVAVRAIPQSRAAGQFPTFLAVRSAADSGVRIYYYNDGPYNTAYRFGTASTQADIFGPNSLTYGVSRWFGASVTSGAQIASSAGVQVGSTQTLAVPMDQTVMGIGNDAAASPSNHARIHIQTIKFWPRAFSVAELNAVTT